MLERYRCARDLFEAARDAACEMRAAREQLARLESRALHLPSPLSGDGRGGRRDVNGTAASNDHVDYESSLRARLADDAKLLDAAMAVAYGPDGKGGVAALLGSCYADALFWRYLKAEPWETCARMCCTSVRTARRRACAAFDAVDGVGLVNAVNGNGIAED